MDCISYLVHGNDHKAAKVATPIVERVTSAWWVERKVAKQ